MSPSRPPSDRSRAPIAAAVVVVVAAAIGLLATAGPAEAQAVEVWNSRRALDLVARARSERSSTAVDTVMQTYQARATGYVYFFLDRPDADERTLVKADQVALDVFWSAPNRTRQRIVGLRDQKVLPTRIRYHLDHLTVVQDDFGDWIRIGDGDEVERVLHPVGPASETMYDFLLADSLTLRYGSEGEEVRVYELRVRPRTPEMPGFIGSVFVDRDAAAIVRMSFTFTPTSYVDPYLDYIRISLDNALWLGRYWLPYRQEVELRREMPALDFLAGSIIRGRYEIGGYDFDPELSPDLFAGSRVTALPEATRRAFPFERGLFDDLEEVGLAPTPSLEEVRAEARRIAGERALSGLAPLRLHLRSASDAVRYNRAEGLFVGGGFQLRPSAQGLVRLSGGYAEGRGRVSAALRVVGADGPIVPEVGLFWDEPRDLGSHPGSSGVINTLGSAAMGKDYLDPWFARGLRLTLRGPSPDGPGITLGWERHASARNVVGGDTRPVRGIDEGIVGSVTARLPLPDVGGIESAVEGRLGRLGPRNFSGARAIARWELERPGGGWSWAVDGAAGLVSDAAPAQELHLIGGRGTLLGHDYRGFVGTGYWLVRAVGSHPLLPPWVGLRTTAALGATHLPESHDVPPDWRARDSDGLRASLGAGLSIGWDVLHLDVARGFPDGDWALALSVRAAFHPWL